MRKNAQFWVAKFPAGGEWGGTRGMSERTSGRDRVRSPFTLLPRRGGKYRRKDLVPGEESDFFHFVWARLFYPTLMLLTGNDWPEP